MSSAAPDPTANHDAQASSEPVHARRIRSFAMRAGRLSQGQQRALETWAPQFCLPYTEQPIDWQKIFGRHAPRIVEIGFGMGTATAEIAKTRSQDDFLGLEVHPPGVGALLKQIDAHNLTNIRIIQHDAVDVFEQMLAPDSLDGIHIFFPDPWPKARHHKRRLIQSPFIALLATRLKPGGYLHCATDWKNYAEQMLAVLTHEPNLVNTASAYTPRPDYRPVTKFEQRGLRLGHSVWDLVFRKRAQATTPLTLPTESFCVR